MLHNLFLLVELETCFSKQSNFSYIIYANLITLYALMKVNSYANQRYFYLSSVFSEAACVMAYQILLFSFLPFPPSQGVPGFLVADTFKKKQCIFQSLFPWENTGLQDIEFPKSMASVQWSKVDAPSKTVVCLASFLWFSLWFSSLLSGSSVPIFLLRQNLTSNKLSKLFPNTYFTFLFWCCCWHYWSRIPPLFTHSCNRFSLCKLLNWSANRQVSDKAVQAKTPTAVYNPQKGCDSNLPGLALPSGL